MLCVSNCIPDDILEKDLQHASRFFIYEAADTLNASSSGKTPDGRLCDALDVITQNLPVPFRTSFSQTLTSLSTSRHLLLFKSPLAKGPEIESQLPIAFRDSDNFFDVPL